MALRLWRIVSHNAAELCNILLLNINGESNCVIRFELELLNLKGQIQGHAEFVVVCLIKVGHELLVNTERKSYIVSHQVRPHIFVGSIIILWMSHKMSCGRAWLFRCPRSLSHAVVLSEDLVNNFGCQTIVTAYTNKSRDVTVPSPRPGCIC